MEKYTNPHRSEWATILGRPQQDFDAIRDKVDTVFRDIQEGGDKAVLRYTAQFDGVQLQRIRVSAAEAARAAEQVPVPLQDAIHHARLNIEKFHRAQQTKPVRVETRPGVDCWQEKKAIQKVGLYVPGGTAPLFSTVLMLAIPAKIAGCSEIVLCTPPGKDGNIHPAILYTARLCGIEAIYKVGGIQAIAAMTWGTESIPAVYKIFGPGNQFVTLAKQKATQYGVAIDMPAGPSELLVLADETANPDFIAADLLSQAEHGPDSQVLLVTTSPKLQEAVEQSLEAQMKSLPRKAIAEKAIANSRSIYVTDERQAIDLVNAYAPEHLIISCQAEAYYLEHLVNAGSVFVGPYTPESAGDYASGTNHTLPTHGFARQYSGVNLDSFLKSITFQKISESGIREIGNTIETMAAAEGLWAHRNAVSIRLKALEKTNSLQAEDSKK